MRTVVCNTGPLIALGLLNKLSLLRDLFSEVIVPEAVRLEIENGGMYQLGLTNFRSAGWIKVAQAPAKRDVLLETLLDSGEASVIGVAVDRKIQTVLIDERKARKVAREVYLLQVIGTARVLVESRKSGLLNEIAPCFQQLLKEGYWIHESIVKAALAEVGEGGQA